MMTGIENAQPALPLARKNPARLARPVTGTP